MTLKSLKFNGTVYNCLQNETVLDALLRQNVTIPHSCKKQNCLSCMMQSLNGPPPPNSQSKLKETLRLQNNFLACACVPANNMEIALNQENLLTRSVITSVVEMNDLNCNVLELVLQCATPINFFAGQSVLLLNNENAGEKFLISSPSSAKTTGKIEIHVDRNDNSIFSQWLRKNLTIGDKLNACFVGGEMFYVPGQPNQPLLLVGWQHGLSAIIGVVQDIFEFNHSGSVYLFHSVDTRENLYFESQLRQIGDYFPNFHYVPCVEAATNPTHDYTGNINEVIPKTLPNLANWKIFLCGTKDQVHRLQRYAYLAGASMKDIYLEVISR